MELKILVDAIVVSFQKNVGEDPCTHTRALGKNASICEEMCTCVFLHIAYFHIFSPSNATKMDNFGII